MTWRIRRCLCYYNWRRRGMAMTLTTTSVALFVDNAGPRPSVLAKGALQDHAKAFYWFSKAAKQGFAQGQLSLGLAYR